MKRWMLLVAALLVVNHASAANFSYSLSGAVTLQTGTDGFGSKSWNPDGTKVSYLKSPGVNNEVWVADLSVSPVTNTQLIQLSDGALVISQSTLAWSPDGAYILYVTSKFIGSGYRTTISKCSSTVAGSITDHVLDPDDFGLPNSSTAVRDPFITQIGSTWWLVVAAVSISTGPPTGAGIWAIQISSDGTPQAGTQELLVDGATGLLQKPRWNGTCDGLLVEQPWTVTDRNLWLVRNVQNVINDVSAPVADLGDVALNRVHSVLNTSNTNYVTDANFSQDGSLVFYVEDVNGVYNEQDQATTLPLANFEIQVELFSDVAGDAWVPYTLAAAGNQDSLAASPGGTRLCYVDRATNTLKAASLTVNAAINTNSGTGATLEGPLIQDGAGTDLVIPVGTVITQPAKDILRTVSIYTPLTPLEEIQISGLGLVLHRRFLPSGTVFSGAQSVEARVHYTDSEIAGFSESSVRLYEINSSRRLVQLEILSRDMVNNFLTVRVTGFSEYFIADPQQLDGDIDGDGLSDGVEASIGTDSSSADTDGDGLSDDAEINIYGTDPLNQDTDGDGVSDGTEVSLGTDPLDPFDFPATVPVVSTMGIVGAMLLFFVLFLLGALMMRQKSKEMA